MISPSFTRTSGTNAISPLASSLVFSSSWIGRAARCGPSAKVFAPVAAWMIYAAGE
jgi:hypothetical protein